MVKNLILIMVLFFCSFSYASEDFSCDKLLNKEDCKKINYLLYKIEKNDDISFFKKNYIKNKLDKISYQIHHKNINLEKNKKEYLKLFEYLQAILKEEKKEDLSFYLEDSKNILWELLVTYSNSKYYKENYNNKENDFY